MKGRIENISGRLDASTISLSDVWNVELDGYFHSSRKDKPLVLQVKETDMVPVTNRSLIDIYNACTLCRKSFNKDEIKISKSKYGQLSDLIQDFKSKLDTSLPKKTIWDHPTFRLKICGDCFDIVVARRGDIKSCLFCAKQNLETYSFKCQVCKFCLCVECIWRKELNLHSFILKRCAHCLYYEKIKLRHKEIRNFKAQLSERKETSKPTKVNEPRRDVLRELEMGEKVFGGFKNSLSQNKQLIQKILRNPNKTFGNKEFSEKIYYSVNSIKLIQKNVFQGSGTVQADLYVESYFDELMRAPVEQIGVKKYSFYSEMQEKKAMVKIFSNSYSSMSGALRESLLNNLKGNNIQTVPKNLNLAPEKLKHFRIILEGRSGEYYIASDLDFKKDMVLFEIVGEVNAKKVENKFIIDKQIWVDESKTVCLDLNLKGNIGHYVQFSSDWTKSNLEKVVYVQKGSEPHLRVFVVASKEIKKFTRLVVYDPIA